jgi:hypothetical protein
LTITMALGADSTTRRNFSSASLRPVRLRAILLTPMTWPASSWLGEMARETSIGRPSLASRTDS